MTRTLKIALPIVILLAGVGIFIAGVKSKEDPERTAAGDTRLLVQTEAATPHSGEVSLRASGQVIPAQQVIVMPEVGGRIRWQHEDLVPGGRIPEGERLVRIDSREYSLQVQSSAAEVNRAELNLRTEQGRQRVAQREWESFGGDGAGPGRDLALREPQIQTAEVGVRAAQSAAQRARLALSRTTLRAPFNAIVVAENAEPGQLVGPASQIATLVGTDQFWVRVSVPVASLQSITLPSGDTPGSEVQITQRIGEQEVVRTGHVERLLPDVEQVGSMARLLVSIDDPMALAEGNTGSLPILLGSHVDVRLSAQRIEGAVEIPIRALRGESQVYVASAERTLNIREVVVAQRGARTALIRSGLSAGETVITSRIPVAVEGVAIRTPDDPVETAPAATGADSEESAETEE